MIIQGDAGRIPLPDESVDCIVTDPPYGYAFMNKDWDKAVIPSSTWKECLRVLKPGAFTFIMSSPRQDVLSRMIVNLQDAGFKTDFTSIYWTYASGFPKASNISKLIDKREGIEREVIGINKSLKSKIKTQAIRLDGSYGGFQPKPAVEVILVVMKPLSEKSFTDQALANGKGVTWLDDCRIPYQSEDDKCYRAAGGDFSLPAAKGWNQNDLSRTEYKANQQGRFPANLLVSDDVLNDGKITKSSKGGFSKSKVFDPSNGWNQHNMKQFNDIGNWPSDSGSYSRYFDLDKWYDTTFPFAIMPKASKSERNRGLDQWMPTTVNDGRKTEIDNPFQRGETPRVNRHPTVKPLKVMSYLITLGSRPNDLILDPFVGSGTTVLAAQMLNRRAVGLEISAEYAAIAQARSTTH